MKASKRFLIWIIISLFLQCSLYIFLDKIYFSEQHNIIITKIDNIIKKKTIKPNVTFPDGATDIMLSYDGAYTSYFDVDGNLKVSDTTTGKFKDISFSGDAKCISYKWLPDTDKIMLVEKLTVSGGRYIKFYSYDPNKETKLEIRDYGTNQANYVNLYDEKTKADIEVSTLTGLMYIKIYSSKITSSIYRIDRNEQMTKVSTYGRRIGNIAVASHDDHLAYEDLTNNKIRTNTKEGVVKISSAAKLFLLGADASDNIYVGKNENGKVSSIFFGKLSDIQSSWEQINIEQAATTDKIFILQSGDVYIAANSSLKRTKDGKTIKYKGTLIGIFNNYLASIVNSKLSLQDIGS
jgi:hypothetical protein